MTLKKATTKEQRTEEIDNSYPFINGYTDKDGVFHADYSIREMNGSDEEAYSKADIKTNGGKIIRVLLERSCTRIGTLYAKDFTPTAWREIIQDLNVSEQDRILLTIRELSVGKELELHHDCPNQDCKQKLITYMDTDEIEVVEYNGVDMIEFELPKGVTKNGELLKQGHMRRPKGIDREVLDPIARKNIGTANTLLLTRCLVDLEGKAVNDQLVREMSIKDREYLLKVLSENNYGYNLQAEITCSHCDESFMTTLNIVNFI